MEGGRPPEQSKRSDEGLLGLLGTYASDEEELDLAEGLQRQQSSDEAAPAPEESKDLPTQALEDLTAAMTAASRHLEVTQLQEGQPSEKTSPMLSDTADADAEMTEEKEAELYWLPPALADLPAEQCPQDIQDKVADYIRKQEATGTTISNSLRSLSGYRNPDFLQHCVMYDNISEYGTCYPSEVFDPTNLPAEDYYDRLAAEWQHHAEKQRMERSKAQKIDFAKSGTETIARPPAAGLNSASVAANLVAQAKASARASKWDSKR